MLTACLCSVQLQLLITEEEARWFGVHSKMSQGVYMVKGSSPPNYIETHFLPNPKWFEVMQVVLCCLPLRDVYWMLETIRSVDTRAVAGEYVLFSPPPPDTRLDQWTTLKHLNYCRDFFNVYPFYDTK